MVQVKWALLAGLLVVFAALSGCVSGPDGEKGKPAATATSIDHSGHNGTVNQPPVAKIRVLSNGLEVPVVQGSAEPEAGDITLDASGSTDPDGDTLSFSWSVDGKAQSNKTASITVPLAVGNHTANLTLADGKNLTSAGLKLVVKAKSAAGGGGGGANAVVKKVFTGSFAQKIYLADPANAVHEFEVPAGATQIVVWVKWVEASTLNAPVEGDIDIYLLDPTGKEVDKNETGDFEYLNYTNPKAGIPGGKWKLELFPYKAIDMDYTATVIVLSGATKVTRLTGSHEGKANAGETSGFDSKKVPVPADALYVSARLTWKTPASSAACSATNREAVDYDLWIYKGAKVAESGAAVACEFAFVAAEPGKTLGAAAEYEFRVAPFLVPSATYELIVTVL